jgi:hypothetical protein
LPTTAAMEPAPWKMWSPERLSAFHLETKPLRRSWKSCLSITMSSAMMKAAVGRRPSGGLTVAEGGGGRNAPGAKSRGLRRGDALGARTLSRGRARSITWALYPWLPLLLHSLERTRQHGPFWRTGVLCAPSSRVHAGILWIVTITAAQRARGALEVYM